MKNIFISYRRDDDAAAAMAGRLYDSLSGRFGQERVFFDVDSITGGELFEKRIAKLSIGSLEMMFRSMSC